MSDQDRRYAAIMFTDIVGYTALMGADEDKAFEVLRKSQEIHNQVIERFNGILIKEMGDGMLITFSLASDAVRCAMEIQKECKAQHIPLKIGIHEGEMVFADADVLGDAVNIASRLQDDAEEGSINISSSVHNNVRNKAAIKTRFVEERAFKNVVEPVKVYRVLDDGEEEIPVANNQKNGNKKYMYYTLAGILIVVAAIMMWKYLTMNSAPPEVEIEKSIAVMPFDNESTDEENEYFVNGMMEDIRNSLSKIGELRVISKTSTEKYRKVTLSAQEIGRELLINYLLEGTVQKLGDQLKIHAQLISVENDDHIWEDTYLRDITDVKEVFEIQSSIAQAIANELKAVITPEEKEQIASIPTENAEAYDLYLKGVYLINQFEIDRFIQALDRFEQAVELDSNFALAYYGIALSYIYRSSVWGDLSPDKASSGAILNANKALDLNPYLGEAYTILGFSRFHYQWDFEGAEASYLKALKLNPSNSQAIRNYTDYLNQLERHEEALTWQNKLLPIDPLSNSWVSEFYLGRFDAAIQTTRENLTMRPSVESYGNLGFVLLNTGSYQGAIDAQHKALELASRRLPRVLAWLAAAYAKNEQEDEAVELLNELKEIREQSLAGSPSFYIAVIYSALDKKELAFQWLEKAYEDHDMEMVWLKIEPQLYSLHADPRFHDLAERVGFEVTE